MSIDVSRIRLLYTVYRIPVRWYTGSSMEEQQKQHEEILKAVGELSKKTDELSDKTDEILEAVGHFADKTEKCFDALESDMSDVKRDVAGFKSEMQTVKSSMVTKDYLDDKLSDLKGDLTVLMRKEDRKLIALVDILETRKVISQEDANKVLELEPFPQSR